MPDKQKKKKKWIAGENYLLHLTTPWNSETWADAYPPITEEERREIEESDIWKYFVGEQYFYKDPKTGRLGEPKRDNQYFDNHVSPKVKKVAEKRIRGKKK